MSSQLDEWLLRMTGPKVKPRCFKHKPFEPNDSSGMHLEDLIKVSHCALRKPEGSEPTCSSGDICSAGERFRL